MRVLLTSVGMGRGGDAVQWAALAEGFRQAGHQVMDAGAVAVRPYRLGPAGAGARGVVRRLPWWARDALELALAPVAVAGAWVAARRGVDLVVHRAATYDVVGPLLAALLGVPVIALLDSHLSAERQYRGESYWRRLHAWTTRRLGRAVVLAVTPSQEILDFYRAAGIPVGKIVARPNGVLERHIRAGLEAGRTSAPMATPGRCVLGFVGSLADWHRVDLLLEALAMLAARADGIAYRLVVIGTGREEARLQALASRRGVSPFVEWRGPLPHDEAVAAMAGFDVAVLPLTLPTGAPVKLVEYAAMGRPIVAPGLPNIRALLAPGAEAILVEPGSPVALAEAVAALARHPAEAQRLGRAAQARVRTWTWEEMARLLVQAASQAARTTASGAGARERVGAAGPGGSGPVAHDKR